MISTILLCLSLAGLAQQRDMDPDRMLAVIRAHADDVAARGNQIQFTLDGVRLVLIYDVKADRMRIITPIMPIEDLALGQLEQAMQANFHTALDARYALSNGAVWSAFIHPLSDLTEPHLRSAMRQVVNAKLTFGDTYTSGRLVFPNRRPNDP